jgi:hypothetical protein
MHTERLCRKDKNERQYQSSTNNIINKEATILASETKREIHIS